MNTLPIGIQDFPTLRERGHVYVDKTRFIAPLLESGGYFFLSRPRRFGKSLLVSTLKAIFDGRKDLFTGLWLEEKHNFAVHPVIRLDFSKLDFSARSLEVSLLLSLQQSAAEYGFFLEQDTVRSAFEELIYKLAQQAKVVVLIDEYDKPITDYLLEPEKRNAHQAVLRSLYGVLKPMNQYLELVFLTGVSKIGKLSLFSDLNNLQDISLNAKYALLCGYSRTEIEAGFPTYMTDLAQKFTLDFETLWQRVKHWYNGYSWDGVNRLYCPFSFLLFLEQQEFKSYWYETGTPTFLVDLIRLAKVNPLEFEDIELPDSEIRATNVDRINPTSLMFQTGYLTILSQSTGAFGVAYHLGYPNQEVRQAFSNDLILEYTQQSYPESFNLKLYRMLEKLDWDGFFAVVNQVLASIPYEIFRREQPDRCCLVSKKREEAYPHSLLHIMLLATGFRTQSQVQTSLGRIDILLETLTHQIIFEIKTSGTPEDALLQIEQNQYAAGLELPVVQLGVVFSLEQKAFTAWLAKMA
jgi:hypothetical protein